MPHPNFRARSPMLPVLSLLSACTVAFVPPSQVVCSSSLRSTCHERAAAFASPPGRCHDLPRSRSRLPRRLQCPLLRASMDGAEDGAEDGGGAEGDGAGAGMGLGGEWQVKSGQGKKPRGGLGGDAVGSVPGQLPERTRDGQDWAEWAREWRMDPQGKANRLVEQWDAESKANGKGTSQESSKKRKSKKKKKGKSGPSRGVVGSGFGGASRQTKSVPEGLVVSQTGGGDEDLVDWSSGQQLTESNRMENMAADWQQDAKQLESLDPSDREKLAEKLRMALGKKPRKTKKKAPPVGDRKGFASVEPPAAAAAAAGKAAAKIEGDGRGALTSAAAAAGASPAKDVAGVSVFPAASGAAAAAAVVVDKESDREGLRPGDDADESGGEKGALLANGGSSSQQGRGGVKLGGANVVSDEQASSERSSRGATVAGIEAEGESGRENLALATERTDRKDSEIPTQRVMGFGRGVAIVEPAVAEDVESVETIRPSVNEAEAGTGEGPSNVKAEVPDIRKFGRGVSIVVEEGGEKDAAVSAAKESQQTIGSADERLRGFGRGVAFPAQKDA